MDSAHDAPAHDDHDLPPWLEGPEDWPTVEQTILDQAVETCLTALDLSGPDPANARLVRYYDTRGGNAGPTFLDLAPRDPDDITASDLLATSLLDAQIRAADVRRLLTPGPVRERVTEALQALPDATLWTADTATLVPMSDFYRAVRDAFNGEEEGAEDRWAVASKLCARKRPDLFPVRDVVVRKRLGIPEEQDYRADWQVFRHVTRTPEVVHALTAALEAAALESDPDGVPIDNGRLRLLDVVLFTQSTGD